jgi:hypothetical protein
MAKQLKRDALQRQGEMMFIELGQTAKAIAEALEVTEKTVGAWRQKGDWDVRRDELFASPHKLREILLKEMRWIADGNPPRMDTDALSKVNKVFEGFGNKVTPQIVMTVLRLLDDFMADTDPELANKNLEPHKKFILHMINLHG